MIIAFCIILLVILWGVKLVPAKEAYRTDYMSMESTTMIKGVFILIIFLTHGEGYLTLGSGLDTTLWQYVRMGLGQSVVTMFFLYSGYGIMESFKKKGEAYIKGFPKYRLLKVLIHFDIAVLLFCLMQLAFGETYTPSHVLLSFIGWTSMGNSNWFIFDILVAYAISFVALGLTKKDTSGKRAAFVVTALSIVFVLLMICYRETRFYNTFLCFALGMWWSLYRPKVESVFLKSKGKGTGLTVFMGLLYFAAGLALVPVYEECPYLYIPVTLIFSVTMLLVTMLVRFHNKVLAFFGEHLFSIFILMRLPMEVFYRVMDALDAPAQWSIFLLGSLAITVLLAVVFDKSMDRLDRVLFKSRATPTKS